ncbi:MAG: M20 family metallopeptidase [Candidatus Nanohalobium sp.]
MAAVEDEIKSITEDLVKFRTVDGNEGEFEKAFDYIKDYFSGTGLEISEYEFDGVKSLVVADSENPEIMTHGHIDVVPADEEMFEPETSDGKMYGRGTADMKAGVAALMKLLKEKSDENTSLGLMITADEEKGGFKGAKKLAEEFNPEFFISAEPNNTSGYLEIINKQKGVMKIDISAEGKNAHASRPWNGENAAEKLWEKFSQFRKNFSTRKEDWGTTLNLGNFKSEGPSNVVPDEAEAGLDIRWTEKYSPEMVKEDLKGIEGLNFTVNAEESMLNTDEENRFVQKLKEASEEVLDDKVPVTKKEPASDARHFSDKGVPSVVFGPEGYNVHEDGEYAVVSSFGDYYRAVENFVEKA